MPSTPKKGSVSAAAVHIKKKDSTRHVVGVGNIKVMLTNDDGAWFAQGLEIDFGAEAPTMEQAVVRFREDLSHTIDEHLKIHGNIVKLLKVAPPQVWREFHETACLKTKYSNVTEHIFTVEEVARQHLPYEGLTFLSVPRHA